MSESDYWRKHALECLRLEADCLQLAGVVHDPALQTHFVRMAREWSNLAVQGPKAALRLEPNEVASPSPRADFATSTRQCSAAPRGFHIMRRPFVSP